jgi:hypothetical protein
MSLWMPCLLGCKSKTVLRKPLEHQMLQRHDIARLSSKVFAVQNDDGN